MKLIGVDVGGTFTDVVFADTDADLTLAQKVPTTPDDPSRGALDGIRTLLDRHDIAADQVGHVFHGTTIATNAVLEYDGAVTGMITNRGFRDVIHIGRHQRPQNYSIMQDIPWQARPLVRRRHRHVVGGRLAPPRGQELEPLDEDGVRQAARDLRDADVQSIAICFLFSYLDPSHEERARDIVLDEYPEAFVTTSASIAPQFREFERFTTAAMNTFIGPGVRTYVRNFSANLANADVAAEFHIMGSHGGVATAASVADRPVQTLLSGPAAGVLGGAWSAAAEDRDHLITFDVGGTSADIGIVVDGHLTEATARDTWIGGYPVLVPMVDISTIGAGGGSIAHVDDAGAFRVGPQSAGSQPGPACYGRGGDLPTVTDANLVLGRLDKDNFLGGDMTLDETAAHRTVDGLARELGIDKLSAAEGVLTIVNNNMANAIRARTVQKGLDPRDFSLVAFGGAGPLHGAEVAAILGIPEVIVPRLPGLTSAAGLLTTDLKYDGIKTAFQVRGSVDLARLNTDLAALEDSLLAQFARDGLGPDEVTLERAGDLRYVGQGYELRVELPLGEIDAAALDRIWIAFDAKHAAEYGHAFADSPIEIVNVRLVGRGALPKIGHAKPNGAAPAAEIRHGRCNFRIDGELRSLETAFYDRTALAVGTPVPGPAIVLQHDTTCVVPPGWVVTKTAVGNMVLTNQDKAAGS